MSTIPAPFFLGDGDARLGDATHPVIENMTHVFKDTGRGQDAAYLDPTVPFAEGFTAAVLEHVVRE